MWAEIALGRVSHVPQLTSNRRGVKELPISL